MLVDKRHYRTIWLDPEDEGVVRIIDQRALPFRFVVEEVRTAAAIERAIREMRVRGAGLIGAAAGYGMYLAARELSGLATAAEFDRRLAEAGRRLRATRPTAVNLEWAVERQLGAVAGVAEIPGKVAAAKGEAAAIADEDAESCRRIGGHGLELIREIHRRTGRPVEILTHCNAGWLAFVDFGTATAPIYAAHDAGIPLHVWVDETRPRNQGSRLTAWELGRHGVAHTVITDNAGGHLMQHGRVDLVLTGADRVTRTGDAANKIGTYLKALAARDNRVPFYVALPFSSFDWEKRDGVGEIPIEERAPEEVTSIGGMDGGGTFREVRIAPESSPAANFGFDVTPARLLSGIITERGICEASEAGILRLYPEKGPARFPQASAARARPGPSLQGRRALVTGGASGIGRACVEALQNEGALVAAIDISEGVRGIPGALPFVCDLTDDRAVAAAVEGAVAQLGGLDLLVSNAGIFPPSASIESLDPASWGRSLDLNLTSHFRLLQACFPHLKMGQDPNLILIASKNVAAPGPGAAAYSVAKAGLTQLGRIAALEWGRHGIRVNMVHPNAVFDTAIWTPEVLRERAARYGLSVDDYKRANVLKVEITSRDVARLVCALAGEAFAKTTGAQIPIDGGNERVI